MRSILRWFGYCDHANAVRERREVGGVWVLHFVCPDCRRMVPVVDRTVEEHREIVAAGRIAPLKAVKGRGAEVIDIQQGRR